MTIQNDRLIGNSRGEVILFVAGLSICVTLICMRFFVLPFILGSSSVSVMQVVYSILDSLIAALVSSIIVSLVFLYVSGKKLGEQGVQRVLPTKLKKELEAKLGGTDRFRYRGHTAKWTVCETIPRLAADARNRSDPISVYVEILNPQDGTACAKYVELKRRVEPPSERSELTVECIQCQLVGTILSLFCWAEKEPLLKFRIGLTSAVSLLRVDCSSNAIFLTTPYIRESALLLNEDAPMYAMYEKDIIFTFEMSIHLNYSERIAFSDLSEEKIRDFLSRLAFQEEFINNLDIARVISFVKSPPNPFLQ